MSRVALVAMLVPVIASAIVAGAAISSWTLASASVGGSLSAGSVASPFGQLDSVPRLERQRNLGQRVNRRLADVLDVAKVFDEPGRIIEGGKTTKRRGAVRRGKKTTCSTVPHSDEGRRSWQTRRWTVTLH